MASKPQPHILGSGPTRSGECDSTARHMLRGEHLPSGQKHPSQSCAGACSLSTSQGARSAVHTCRARVTAPPKTLGLLLQDYALEFQIRWPEKLNF